MENMNTETPPKYALVRLQIIIEMNIKISHINGRDSDVSYSHQAVANVRKVSRL